MQRHFAAAILVVGLAQQACGADPAPAVIGEGAHVELPLATLYAPELGKGTNLAETRTYARCVTYPEVKTRAATFGRRVFDETSVKSRVELNSKLDVSASVAAKAFWGSADFGAGFFKNVAIGHNSDYWLVNARFELLHESIDTSSREFALSEHARELLKSGGWPAFKRVCGSQFYVGRTLGAQYSLLYEFVDSKSKRLEKIYAYGKAEGLGLSVAASFEQTLEEAKQANALKVHVEVLGGDDTVSVRALEPKQLSEELTHLSKSLGQRHGDVLSWETLGYEIFAEVASARVSDAPAELDAEHVDRALVRFYEQYAKNLALINEVQETISRAEGDLPWHYFGPGKIEQLNGAKSNLARQNLEIETAARACMGQGDDLSCSREFETVSDLIPKPDMDFSGVGTWQTAVFPGGDTPLGLKLVAWREDGNGRIFDMQGLVYSTAGGIYGIAPEKDGRNWPVMIGEGRMTDANVVDLCTGAFSRRCHLRITQSPRFSDRYGPIPILVIAMLDEKGKIVKQYDFSSVSTKG